MATKRTADLNGALPEAKRAKTEADETPSGAIVAAAVSDATDPNADRIKLGVPPANAAADHPPQEIGGAGHVEETHDPPATSLAAVAKDTTADAAAAAAPMIDLTVSPPKIPRNTGRVAAAPQRKPKVKRNSSKPKMRGSMRVAAETGAGPSNRDEYVREKPRVHDVEGTIRVNVDEDDQKPVFACPDVQDFMHAHQKEGVRFLWKNCMQDENGAVLAHLMGLGKTLTSLTFIEACLRSERAKHVLLMVPVNTITNWANEARKWFSTAYKINVFDLAADGGSTTVSRLQLMAAWRRKTGILLVGFEMFRALALAKRVDASIRDEVVGLLTEVPELVVIDEGHRIKNAKSALTRAVRAIKTRRRVILTGSPLQNNLLEYFHMIDFVRSGVHKLGTETMFKQRFERPIKAGRGKDASAGAVLLMKKMVVVLRDTVADYVQRRDYSCLAESLPTKHEYIVYVRLSPVQKALYKKYVRAYAKASLFHNYHTMTRIWNHPDCLINAERDRKEKEEKELAKSSRKAKKKAKTEASQAKAKGKDRRSPSESKDGSASLFANRVSGGGEGDDGSSSSDGIMLLDGDREWWKEMLSERRGYTQGELSNSGKLVLTIDIVRECRRRGDKVLIFSQSLVVLDLIEKYLRIELKMDARRHYVRLDGSTPIEERERDTRRFNETTGDGRRLCVYLISTRAGGLGINLVSASRVIVFDVSWNPANDLQAIFRTYRFGQKKEVYVYRLVAAGTMEQRIFERQVTKMGMSLRVVDEHEIGREYTERSLKELYRFQDSDDEGLADDADKVRVQLAAAVEREGIDDAAVEAAEATVPLATSGDGDGDGDGSADEPSGAEVSIALSSDEDELGSQSDVSPGVEDWEFQIPEGRDRTRRSRARRKKALARMRSRKRRGRRRAGDDDDSDEGAAGEQAELERFMAAMMGQSGADDRRAAERARLVVEGHDAALAVGMGGRGRELALIRSVQDQVMQIVLKKYFAVASDEYAAWVKDFLSPDALLEDKDEEHLTEEEASRALQEYNSRTNYYQTVPNVNVGPNRAVALPRNYGQMAAGQRELMEQSRRDMAQLHPSRAMRVGDLPAVPTQAATSRAHETAVKRRTITQSLLSSAGHPLANMQFGNNSGQLFNNLIGGYSAQLTTTIGPGSYALPMPGHDLVSGAVPSAPPSTPPASQALLPPSAAFPVVTHPRHAGLVPAATMATAAVPPRVAPMPFPRGAVTVRPSAPPMDATAAAATTAAADAVPSNGGGADGGDDGRGNDGASTPLGTADDPVTL